MKFLTFPLLFFIILSSCGKQEVPQSEEEKSDFYVSIIRKENFSGTGELIKSGQVQSTQDINLSSNANGQVQSVLVKVGDQVSAGQTLARLSDSLGNYGTNLSRAGNGVERAKIQYEAQKISLDKQVFDARVQLEKLQNNRRALIASNEQNLIQAENTLKNSEYSSLDSASALQLERLDNAIERARLEYETKLIADKNTLESYQTTLRKEFTSMELILDDTIDFADTFYGFDTSNRRFADRIEDYFGMRDISLRNTTRDELRKLMSFRDSRSFIEIQDELTSQQSLTPEQIQESIALIESAYTQSIQLLQDLEGTLNESLNSPSNGFGPTEIATFISQINALQSQIQGNFSAFISFSSGAQSFLQTYEQAQESLLRSIDLQKEDRDIQKAQFESNQIQAETGYNQTIIGAQDNVQNIDAQINIAQNTLDNAIKTRDVTLRSMQNSIADAQISYSSASKEYAKLTISSPINGSVAQVQVDVGQEVFSGTPMFMIVSDDTPEVIVSFSKDERALVSEGQTVYVKLDSEMIAGKIYAISDVANTSLNYPATIVFESGTNLIGSIVDVVIPIQTGTMMLPLNIITVQGGEIGTVKTLSGSTIDDVRVRMGEMYGNQVEIVSCAKNCDDLQIIQTDMSNFDPNKFVIVEKP